MHFESLADTTELQADRLKVASATNAQPHRVASETWAKSHGIRKRALLIDNDRKCLLQATARCSTAESTFASLTIMGWLSKYLEKMICTSHRGDIHHWSIYQVCYHAYRGCICDILGPSAHGTRQSIRIPRMGRGSYWNVSLKKRMVRPPEHLLTYVMLKGRETM